MQRLSLEISVAFIHVKRCIVLTLWQILQMYVNTLERGKKISSCEILSSWIQICPFIIQLLKHSTFGPKNMQIQTSACRYSGLKVNDVIGFNKDIKTINPPPKSATNKIKVHKASRKNIYLETLFCFCTFPPSKLQTYNSSPDSECKKHLWIHFQNNKTVLNVHSSSYLTLFNTACPTAAWPT